MNSMGAMAQFNPWGLQEPPGRNAPGPGQIAWDKGP